MQCNGDGTVTACFCFYFFSIFFSAAAVGLHAAQRRRDCDSVFLLLFSIFFFYFFFQLRPLAYTLRNGGGTVAACITGWVLEGSQDVDGPWHTLDHRGCKGNRLPMHEHQCTVFNDAASS